MKLVFNKNKIYKGIIVIISIWILYMMIPLPSPLFPEDYSLVIKDKNGKILKVFLNDQEQWCFPESLEDEIPEKLKQSIISFEDKHFYYHPGINPFSISRAAYQNFTQNKIVSGASTISMQVARLLEKNPRTFYYKIKEMFLALKVELYYSKKEILNLYLNHAPFGGNIRGFKAAAMKYFGKMPKDLSWAEAATLAVLPNAPGIISPGKKTKNLKNKRDFLLKKLFKEKTINESTYELAKKEPVINNVFPFPQVAPHLAQRIYNSGKNKNEVYTTIDIEIQKYLESLVKHHSQIIKSEGIRNTALMVTEASTGKIISYIGSQDFFDKNNLGMVDGIQAARSSGSILKPFLYALSIDEGIVLPQTKIKDVRTYFDTFSPMNADEKFNGIVSAKGALIRSLNIPAVRILNTYGVYSFYSFLKNAGVSTLFREADEYGLPLILGGAEVNIFEVSKLYKGLASAGEFKDIYYLKSDSASINKLGQYISPGSSYLTLEMLKELKRPGSEYYWREYQNQKKIAWKTGTSYGGKDAWAVGVTPQWVISVWCGNFDGEANPNLSGAKTAGPLLFETFNYLCRLKKPEWFNKIDIDFKEAIICKETGFLAGEYCDHKDTVEIPINMKPLKVCPYHKNIFIDELSGYSVCSSCWTEDRIEKNILVYPAEVNYHLQKSGKMINNEPDHNPDCLSFELGNQLKILYPVDSLRVWLPRDYDGKLQKLVSRVAYNKPEKKLFWYLNNTFLGETKTKHEKAIEMKKGWQTIIVTDENGDESRVKFFVNVKEN